MSISRFDKHGVCSRGNPSSWKSVLISLLQNFSLVAVYLILWITSACKSFLISFLILSRFQSIYCVCGKHIMPCNCLCSSCSCFCAIRVRNIRASHIRDFGLCHNMKSYVCRNFLIPSENGFGHFKKQLKRKGRVVLKKSFLWSCVVQCENWNTFSILSLLIINYSSVYSIYLFYVSIYLTIL